MINRWACIIIELTIEELVVIIVDEVFFSWQSSVEMSGAPYLFKLPLPKGSGGS